ncbi:MAG: hypothetical protein AUG44_11515 [Actinobacteria bacterium 13_1_20CM_3_71_11]|nr:MAG: hypothetical protein AUG44_11515 [Actinobacteria bacterium 13_1_20CM_3_71_11]
MRQVIDGDRAAAPGHGDVCQRSAEIFATGQSQTAGISIDRRNDIVGYIPNQQISHGNSLDDI